MTNHKSDGLTSKVMKLNKIFFKIDYAEKRMYLPYCNYQNHRGLIKKEEVCQERNCRHYHKLYIDEKNESNKDNYKYNPFIPGRTF